MIQFSVQTEIACPPKEVFAYVTDPATLASWQTNTVAATPEGNRPLGLGTRVREVHRAPGGKQLASLVEVSEYEPDRVFGLRTIEGALPIHARITFEPTELGTRVHFHAHGELTGAMRLAQALLRVTLKRQFAGYCVTLKRIMENSRAPR